ncbi:MAG: terpene cyclase/mutase family protein [Pirellulales bacterium]|nr:terpene cyclase/mutase family protein [Pirellulales bacterium]
MSTARGDSPEKSEKEKAKAVGPDAKMLAETIQKGADYLIHHGQAPDGSYSSFVGSGITALATTALLRAGRTPDDPAVARSLKYLEACVQPDGGIHLPKTRLANYETCVAMLCLSEANKDGRYDKILKRARTKVGDFQQDEKQGKDRSDFSYGGVGYGAKGRPDLSNTAFLIDALKVSGAKADDPAIQKALCFVSRCQNLEGPNNTTPFAAKVNDGGFYYTCALSKMDLSRQAPDGALRSYGAMSYSGLKSMIYAGLTKDDPRLKAAIAWIEKNYDVKTHPGMGDAGLYYYYHTLAKSLDVLGVDTITDAKGVQHDWRKELTEELVRRQRPDGSWVNTDRRWFETDPNLATSFALLALSHCKKK